MISFQRKNILIALQKTKQINVMQDIFPWYFCVIMFQYFLKGKSCAKELPLVEPLYHCSVCSFIFCFHLLRNAVEPVWLVQFKRNSLPRQRTDFDPQLNAFLSCLFPSASLQSLISGLIGEKQYSRTSPMTSSDMTIKKQWKLESE